MPYPRELRQQVMPFSEHAPVDSLSTRGEYVPGCLGLPLMTCCSNGGRNAVGGAQDNIADFLSLRFQGFESQVLC